MRHGGHACRVCARNRRRWCHGEDALCLLRNRRRWRGQHWNVQLSRIERSNSLMIADEREMHDFSHRFTLQYFAVSEMMSLHLYSSAYVRGRGSVSPEHFAGGMPSHSIYSFGLETVQSNASTTLSCTAICLTAVQPSPPTCPVVVVTCLIAPMGSVGMWVSVIAYTCNDDYRLWPFWLKECLAEDKSIQYLSCPFRSVFLHVRVRRNP